MTKRVEGRVRALQWLQLVPQVVLRALGDVFELSPGRARWLLALTLIAITVLALSPQQSTTIDTGWDKLNHMLAFAVLGLLALAASGRHVVMPLLWLLGYGVVLELLQGLTPARVASPADIIADILGLLLGWLLYRCWRIARQRWTVVGRSVGEQAE